MTSLKERLEEVMAAKAWDYRDLVTASGESRSVVSQWLGRGTKTIKSIGKMVAAERLEQASGFSALWIAKGEGPKLKAASQVAEPSLATALEIVSAALAHPMTESARLELQDAMTSWVKFNGGDRWRAVVLSLLVDGEGSRKRTSNGR